MDLLRSMNRAASEDEDEDEEDSMILPEQQTRTVELMTRYPDFCGNLGWDACATCGISLEAAAGNVNEVVWCTSCRRIQYCSEACRLQDATCSPLPVVERIDGRIEDEEEVERAAGHSAVICALLALCADDEAVEMMDNDEGFFYKNKIIVPNVHPPRLEAAQDRVRSEDESYPATLANVIAQGACYQHVVRQCRRSSKPLVLHVLGASIDSEFWGYAMEKDDDDPPPCFLAYADALAELEVDEIELVFVGPECPSKPIERRVRLPLYERSNSHNHNISSSRRRPLHKEPQAEPQAQQRGSLWIRSYPGVYSADFLLQQQQEHDELCNRNLHHHTPDIVVFFNPGFTVPDYMNDWKETLAALQAGTPFLSTTNTEVEGIADCQFLLEQDKIQSLPPGLASIFGLYSSGDNDDDDDENSDHDRENNVDRNVAKDHDNDDDEDYDYDDDDEYGSFSRNDRRRSVASSSSPFFNVNPFCGNRVRQSRTMANDVYVKNRWILGGILDRFDPDMIAAAASSSTRHNAFKNKKKKQRRLSVNAVDSLSSNHNNSMMLNDREDVCNNRNVNQKIHNPALI